MGSMAEIQFSESKLVVTGSTQGPSTVETTLLQFYVSYRYLKMDKVNKIRTHNNCTAESYRNMKLYYEFEIYPNSIFFDSNGR
jgi:hypothetical protein